MDPQINLITKSIASGNHVNITATGNSMFPMIKNGQKVTIQPLNDPPKLFDIIAYTTNSNVIIHQCLFHNDNCVTFGINNNFIDPPFPISWIFGKVNIPNVWANINMFYHQETIRLFGKIQFPIIILKGAPWQKHVFGYYFNKPTSDVDILVQKKHLKRIISILTKDGYSQTSKVFQNEVSFSKIYDKHRLTFDLHFQSIRTSTLSGLKLISPKFLPNYFSKTTKGINYLYRTDSLFYLCLNLFFHHAGRGIDMYAYIAHLISHETVNWNEFWNMAKKLRVSEIIFYILTYTTKSFGLKIPQLHKYHPLPHKRIMVRVLFSHSQIIRPFSLKNSFSNKLNSLIILLLRWNLNQ